MKLYINTLATLTATVYVTAFVFLFSSLISCEKPQIEMPPAVVEKPEMGFGMIPYNPVDSEIGTFTVTASLCQNTLPTDPRNVTVNVWNFDTTTDPDEAIHNITDPEPTDPDDPTSATEIVEPDQEFQVWLRVTEEGKEVTNFRADKTFTFRTDPFTLCVIRVTDEVGNESFTWFKTDTGNTLKICL